MAESLVSKAKLAEQAERYEDMAKVGMKFCQRKHATDVEVF